MVMLMKKFFILFFALILISSVSARTIVLNSEQANNHISISRDQDDIIFTYEGEKGTKSLTLESGAIYNGSYYSMAQINQLVPTLHFSFPVRNEGTMKKYAVNISNIPSAMQPNVNAITLTYKEHSGFELSKLKTYINKMSIDDYIDLGFGDLIQSGFNFNINQSERRIYITNLTFVNNSLYLDPTVTLQSAITMCGINDTYANTDMIINTTVTVCSWNSTGFPTNCHLAGGSSNCGNLTLYAGNLTLLSQRSITASGAGFKGGKGTTSGGQSGQGQGGGGGAANGNRGGGGGGFGGAGGAGTDGAPGGSTYGSTTNVFYMGSGGGGNDYSSTTGDGANGGGAIKLNVSGTLILNGNIYVCGNNRTDDDNGGGGGAGGGLYIDAFNISGSGRIDATGGVGALYGGSGGAGGGRVYIQYALNSSTVTINVSGGSGAAAGNDGSIYFNRLNSYSVEVTSPTTSSPASVTTGQNATIAFNVQNWGVNITSGVNITNISVGGISTNVLLRSYVKNTNSTTYNASTIEYNLTSNLIGSLPPSWDAGWVTGFAAPSQAYTNISTLDGINYELALGTATNLEFMVRANFTINENINDISSIWVAGCIYNIDSSGTSETEGIYVANFTDSTWIPLKTGTFYGTKLCANKTFTTTTAGGLSDIVNTGKLTMLFEAEDSDTAERLKIDYGQIMVNKSIFEYQHLAWNPNVGWQANITIPYNGTANLTGLQDLFINVSYSGQYTNTTAYDVFDFGGTTNTCSCPASGDWHVLYSDNCVITSNCDMKTNNVYLEGSIATGGSFTLGATLFNVGFIQGVYGLDFIKAPNFIIEGIYG
jgi:hypothetical protein